MPKVIPITPWSDPPKQPTENASGSGLNVMVVDDHELVRFGMQTYLRQPERGVGQVLEAASLGQALDTLARQPVHLVLLDLNLPDSKGLATLSLMHRAHPLLPIAVVSGADASLQADAFTLGAAGFFSKLGDLSAVGEWIAEQGRCFATVVRPHPHPTMQSNRLHRQAPTANLQPRQLQVLELLLAGCSNQKISTETGLSLGTVKNHVSSLLLHFQVGSRSQLIAMLR